MTKIPPIPRIVSVDYLASSAFLVPIIAWGFYLCMLTLAPENAGAWAFPVAPGTLTVVGLAVLAWRIVLIRSVFAAGVEAPATVLFTLRMRGQQVRINYQYTYAGQTYTGGNTVSEGRVPVTLKPGDTITVVFDPARPQVAFVRDSFV
jgi:hypothetical protein